LQNRIAAVRAERERAVATRRDAMTGTSEFPNLAETPVNVLLPSALREAVGGGGRDDREMSHEESDPATVPALPSIRLAEPYERLRDASDAQLARTGSRPKVFLANLGASADFTARASVAKNFFEAGGIEALTNEGFSSPEEAAGAFAASGATLACLCSSDDVYALHAAAAAAALRDAGAREVYVASQPGRLPANVAGSVSASIFAGCDALAVLTDVIDKAAR
jgi:methylmalonyl-CoA mutase